MLCDAVIHYCLRYDCNFGAKRQQDKDEMKEHIVSTELLKLGQ
jgi:hypothetical protein